MPGHRAAVRVLALLLERDDELRRLARGCERSRLVVDLEVVLHVPHVLQHECDLARAGERLGREAEEELAGFYLNRLRRRLPDRTSGCQLDDGQRYDCRREEREQSVCDRLSHWRPP